MYTRTVFALLFWLGIANSQIFAATTEFNPQADPLSNGDQAQVEINKGLYADSEVGLLTFLSGGGASVYRPGLILSMRLGYDITNEFTLYGKIGATVTGNTACFISSTQSGSCQAVRNSFGAPVTINGRPLPRQGVSFLLGAGAQWAFLILDDRWFFHLSAEILGQLIPPDSIPEDKLERVSDANRTSFSPGVGFGGGFKAEYYFIQKHFSAAFNVNTYYFTTAFLNNTTLGLAVMVSVGLKYSF